MRECKEYEITIEKLIRCVHSYTTPVRIIVVMDGSWQTCPEAKRMRNFELTKRYRNVDEQEKLRLLKYYKDVPVWNLATWIDGPDCTEKGTTLYMGIEAHCHYEDVRTGYLAEKMDRKRERQREYRERKKKEQSE